MTILEQIQTYVDLIAEESKLPSNVSLISLFGSSKSKKPVGKSQRAELTKLNLVDKNGKITKEGSKLLSSPKVQKKIKELSS